MLVVFISRRIANTIQYDSVYLTCSKQLTGSQLTVPHGINKKLKCETKNKMMSVIGPLSWGSPVLTCWPLSKRLCVSPFVYQFPGRIIGCHKRLLFPTLGIDLRTLIVFRPRCIAQWRCVAVRLDKRCFWLMLHCADRVFSDAVNLGVEKSIAAFGLRDAQLLLLFFAVFVISVCCDLLLPSTTAGPHTTQP